MELERFQRVIDINLVGTFNVIRLAAVVDAEERAASTASAA